MTVMETCMATILDGMAIDLSCMVMFCSGTFRL